MLNPLDSRDNIFLCHSRERGNPDFRFRVKHGMTGKTMLPHTWCGDGMTGCCGVTIKKMSFPYFFLSPAFFIVIPAQAGIQT